MTERESYIDNKKKVNRIRTRRMTAVLLAFVLFAVSAAGFIEKDQSVSATERRALAEVPVFNRENVLSGAFMTQTEDYLADHFFLRDVWRFIGNGLDLLFGEREKSGVIRGTDGTLFLKASEDQTSETTMKTLFAFAQTELSGGSIPMTICLIPNAISVAGDTESALNALLPAGLGLTNQREWFLSRKSDFEQLLAEDGLTDLVSIPDFYEALRSAWEAGDKVFYSSDHHWTTGGAYVCYRFLLATVWGKDPVTDWTVETVCDTFSGTLASRSGFSCEADSIDLYLPKEEYPIVVSYVEEQTKTTTLYSSAGLTGGDPYEVFLGGNHARVDIESGAPTSGEGSLLVLKDSYANAFLPFLTAHYRSITVVDPRYYSGDLSDLMTEREITEVLVLYNMSTFCEDRSLNLILSEVIECRRQ